MVVAQDAVGGLTSVPEDEPLLKPVKDIKDKYEVLPAFLKLRGLAKQHVQSFDYFINHDIKKIVKAKDNNRVSCEADSNFYLRYTDVRVEAPVAADENSIYSEMNPMQCRLRDQTYAAPIKVGVEYVKGKHVVTRTGRQSVDIGRLPLMLRSDRCVLRGKSEEELTKLGECPLDPGGYFIVRGTEKVILIQEQLSKNRVLVDLDRQGNVVASVTSHTTERKVKTNLATKHGRLLLQHNAFTCASSGI